MKFVAIYRNDLEAFLSAKFIEYYLINNPDVDIVKDDIILYPENKLPINDDIEGEIISSSEIVTKANDNNIRYIKLDETSADLIGMDYLIIPADGETFYHADIKTFEEINAEIEADMRYFDRYEDENNVIEPAETKFFKNKVVKPRTYISSYAAENIQIELNAGKFIGKTLEWSIRNE